MGITVGIPLLSCIRAEILVISHLLLVSGGHLWSPTYPDIGQSSHLLVRVAWPHHFGYRSTNFVPIMLNLQGEVRILPVWRLPSWISHFRAVFAMILIVLQNSSTSETWIVFNIVFLSCSYAEIWVFPIWSPPYWIGHALGSYSIPVNVIA
jgi:hypothetical protein